MNTTELKGSWNTQKGKLKQRIASLTDNYIMFENGKKEKILGWLQIQSGKTKVELHAIFPAL